MIVPATLIGRDLRPVSRRGRDRASLAGHVGQVCNLTLGLVPTLIHVNGPSGAGKSTLAGRFAHDHPGTLNLEADRVVTMIGGWRADFGAALAPARRLATAMAHTHLAAGGDVIMPQLATRLDQVACFEDAAARAGARYLEVALIVDPDEQVHRFRSRSHTSELEEHIERYIESRGGVTLLHRIHGHFAEYLGGRPEALQLDTAAKSIREAYTELLTLLG